MIKKSHQIQEVETVMGADSIVYKLNNGELYSIDKKPIKVSKGVFSYGAKNSDIFFQKENLSSLTRVSLLDFHAVNVDGEFSLRGAFFIDSQHIYILGKSKGKKVVYLLDVNDLKVQSNFFRN